MLLDVLSKEMQPGVIILLAEEFDSFSACVILLNMLALSQCGICCEGVSSCHHIR